jgi:hypothetical protein
MSRHLAAKAAALVRVANDSGGRTISRFCWCSAVENALRRSLLSRMLGKIALQKKIQNSEEPAMHQNDYFPGRGPQGVQLTENTARRWVAGLQRHRDTLAGSGEHAVVQMCQVLKFMSKTSTAQWYLCQRQDRRNARAAPRGDTVEGWQVQKIQYVDETNFGESAINGAIKMSGLQPVVNWHWSEARYA